MPTPPYASIAGDMYKLTLFRVESRRPDGTPLVLHLVADDDAADVGRDSEYLLAYVHVERRPQSPLPFGFRN